MGQALEHDRDTNALRLFAASVVTIASDPSALASCITGLWDFSLNGYCRAGAGLGPEDAAASGPKAFLGLRRDPPATPYFSEEKRTLSSDSTSISTRFSTPSRRHTRCTYQSFGMGCRPDSFHAMYKPHAIKFGILQALVPYWLEAPTFACDHLTPAYGSTPLDRRCTPQAPKSILNPKRCGGIGKDR